MAEYPSMWADAPEDAMFIRMSSTEPPMLVDQDVKPLGLEAAQLLFRQGCWVNAVFRAFHYTTGGDPGVGLALNTLQFVRPGKTLGGGRTDPGDILGPMHEGSELYPDDDV
jgi:hypothetical protein